MSQIHFDGPVQVDPALAMALWNSMPDAAKSGVAQLFFSRFVSAPISNEAITAGARVFMEKSKLPEEAAKLLRAAVGKRCKELAENMNDTKAVQAIAADEARKVTTKHVQENVTEIINSLDISFFVEAAKPVILEVIRACAHHYFTRSQQGQSWLIELVQRVCNDEFSVSNAVLSEIGRVAAPQVQNGKVA